MKGKRNERNSQIEQRTELHLVPRLENRDPQVLDQRHGQRNKEEQGEPIRIAVARPRPEFDELPSEQEEPRKDQRQDTILDTSGPDEQVAHRLLARRPGNHRGNLRQEDPADRRRKGHVHVLKLNRHGKDRHGRRPDKGSQDKLPRTPVDSIHDRVQENPERIDGHFLQEAPVDFSKRHPNLQEPPAIEEIGRERTQVKQGRHHDQRHGLVAELQQHDHRPRIQKNPENRHKLLEDKAFVRRDDGTEQAKGKRDREIQHHQEEHHPNTRKLPRRHRPVKNQVRIESQHKTQDDRHQADSAVQEEKHPEHLALFVGLPFGPILGRIADYGVPKSQVENRQVGDDRRDNRIHSVFRLAEHPEQVRRIEQPDQIVQAENDIGKERA